MRTFSPRAILDSLRPGTVKVLLVSMLGVMLSTTDQSLFSYAIPDITAEFRIGLGVIGQILSISFLCASFAIVFVGLAADRFGRRLVFVILLAASAFCVGLHALAPNIWVLATFRILGFATGAGIYLIANTLVVEVAPDNYRGFVAGLLQIGYPLGFTLASIIAAPLMLTYGWRSIFYAGFAITLLAPLVGRLLPESHRYERLAASDGPGVSSAARLLYLFSPAFRMRTIVCFFGSFFVSLAIGGTTYFLPTYLVQAHGLTATQASRIAGAAYAIGAIGYVVASFVGEFVTTRRNTLIIWTLAGAVAFGLTLTMARGATALISGLGLSVLFFYGSEAVRSPLISELFPTHVRATATAVTGSLAVTTAWLISPLLESYLAPLYGWTAAFMSCAVIPLALGGIVFLALVNLPSGISIEDASSARESQPYRRCLRAR